MPTQDVKRKLTAILSADVKGYSRLMEEDEVETIRTLNAYKEVMTNLIQKHRGRVVNAPGDNVLAEFASVVDAVECGVEIQKELKTRNTELPENRRMEFRIGINLGDIVEEGDSILGDGVNIAARMESLAEAGGICISGTAYDQVENKLGLGYQFLGEQTVKNIAKPVRVYKVLTEPGAVVRVAAEKKVKPRKWQRPVMVLVIVLILVAAVLAIWRLYLRPTPPPREVASKEKMAFPLPDKPSIAVLPFVNMSGDPKKDYLSDGITEEIINALSKIPHIFVIARSSTFTYKGKSVKVQQVAEEMGVRYVVEGSVQWSGDRVRITAQLVDATTGHHVFSERYDRDLKDLFALQDDITIKIMTAMQVKLTYGEQVRMMAKGTKNLEAYLKLMQAFEYRHIMTKEGKATYQQLAEEAIALDPGCALAYSFLASSIGQQALLGVYKNPQEALARAMDLAQKAASIDDSLALPHSVLGFIYIIYKRDFEKGIAEAERAVALEPNSSEAYTQLAVHLLWAGRSEEAIALFKKAIRLSPIPPFRCLLRMADAYASIGQYEEAIAIYKKIVKKEPDQVLAHLHLAVTLMLAGKEDEARAEAAEVTRLDPKFSVERFAKSRPLKNQADIDREVDALRKAGLK